MGLFDLKIRNEVRPTSIMFEQSPSSGSALTNKEYVDTLVTTSVSAKSITLTGDVVATGTSTLTTNLTNTGVTAGVYSVVNVDLKGRVISGSEIFLSGDASGSCSNGNLTVILNNTGVTPGDYIKVTVNAQGRVISGVDSLSQAEIITSLGYTPVNKNGDIMAGNLRLQGIPTDPTHAVSKAYVDSKIWLALAVGY